jgi:TolB-like protein/Tfp pilus assembly protein PilF
MDALSRETVFRFDAFRLDRRDGVSRRHESGLWKPVTLGSRALDALMALVKQRGELVTKQALLDAVWPGVAVAEANLTVQISTLRRILDVGRAEGSCIRTVIGRGYRFLPAVTVEELDVSHPGPELVPERGVGTQASHTLSPKAGLPHFRRTGLPRVSVIVAPLRNLGVPKAHEHLADGIAEDIATDLSHHAGTCVVSCPRDHCRNGDSISPRDSARELGVGYAIQGSIRKFADWIRIYVQLIDTESGAHIWAERFDADLNGTADARGEISARLARVLSVKLTEDVNRRIEAVPPRDWTPHDLVMRGRALRSRPYSVTSRYDALRCFEQALGGDPGSIGARMGIAGVLINNVTQGSSQSVEHDLARAEQLLLDVLRDDADIADCHGYMAQLRRMQDRLSESMIELEIALGLDPNNLLANEQLGWTLTVLGRPDAAIPQIERCLRLAPHDSSTPAINANMGQCKLLLGQAEEAIFWLRKAIAGNPRLYYPHRDLAGALGLRDELVEAAAAFRRAIEIKPELASPSGLLINRANSDYVDLFERKVYAGLRRAGLPDIWSDTKRRLQVRNRRGHIIER